MRLIDADALLEKAEWLTWDGDSYNTVNVVDVICAPTIEAEPVRHGRWIYRQDDDDDELWLYYCSECDTPSARKRNYCSNCGAKMDLPNQ